MAIERVATWIRAVSPNADDDPVDDNHNHSPRLPLSSSPSPIFVRRRGSTYKSSPFSTPPRLPCNRPPTPATIATTLDLEHVPVVPDSDEAMDLADPYTLASYLADMLESRCLRIFSSLGGIHGIAHRLGTNLTTGLTDEQTRRHGGSRTAREDEFGINKLPDRKLTGFFGHVFEGIKDTVFLLLSVLTIVELCIGKYVEGIFLGVCLAICIVLGSAIQSMNQKDYLCMEEAGNDRMVEAIRAGIDVKIPQQDILGGDVLRLDVGDIVPADGILISQESNCRLVCDDSGFTGESLGSAKSTGDEALRQFTANEDTATHQPIFDPFIFTGSRVRDGFGTYLVTGVGINSVNGRTQALIQHRQEKTTLEQRLDSLATYAAIYTFKAAGGLVTMIMLLWISESANRASFNWKDFLEQLFHAVKQAIILVIVGIPEGLPLAVRLSLCFASLQMRKKNILVKSLPACEAMAWVTTVCVDKTGTLTMNDMRVEAGILGTTEFADETGDGETSSGECIPLTSSEVFVNTAAETEELLIQSIQLGSTAKKEIRNGEVKYHGCQTETALLRFAEHRGAQLLSEAHNVSILRVYPFDAQNKYMATVVELPNGSYRIYAKGAPEDILPRCTKIANTLISESSLLEEELSSSGREKVKTKITEYGSNSLRTLAMAYREVPASELQAYVLPGEPEDLSEQLARICQDLTLLAVFAMRDPLRPDAVEAMSACRRGGITVVMVTGDSAETATAIAKASNILIPDLGDTVMDGKVFRELVPSRYLRVLRNLRVLARATPSDKQLLVERLREIGEVVAITGDGTNDGPAMKAAHVGIAMGSGTGVAQEAASIVLRDDRLLSIVQTIVYGRTISDSITKFIRVQLSVSFSAMILTLLSSVVSKNTLPGIAMGTTMYLWVNMTIDTLGPLAFSTERPDPTILDRPQDREKASALITLASWRMILGQGLLQVLIIIVVSLVCRAFQMSELLTGTVVFTSYMCGIFFNLLSNRRLDPTFNLNVFEGAPQNPWLCGIMISIILVQILYVQLGGEALHVTFLSLSQWTTCIISGLPLLLSGALIRCLPDNLLLWHPRLRLGRRRVISEWDVEAMPNETTPFLRGG